MRFYRIFILLAFLFCSFSFLASSKADLTELTYREDISFLADSLNEIKNPIGYTHCDIHEMVFYNGTLYVGSDGLISKSTDGGNNWINLSEGLTI
ncbi:hypothetical protein HOK76_00045, partial [archaeon]|nr:hypothetical protein [archaeon]MBT5422866.1 hypothetical protein [archaeon]